MAKILIVGAGDVGGRLACLLAAQQHEVYALRRQPVPLAGVQLISADVTRAETLTALPKGLDIVVFALSAGAGGEEAYQRVYLEGTRNVLTALQDQSLQHVFWLSSTGVYGECQGEWIDESTPAQPATATGKVLLAAERCVQSFSWPSTMVRLGGLYGPGRHRLLRWVQSGKAVQISPPSWSNRIHVADAAGFLAHLCARVITGQPVLPLYLAVDDAPTPQAEVLTWLAEQMQLSAPPALTVDAPTQGKRIRNQGLRETGYQFMFPDYRAGYTQVLQLAKGA
ncbi:MAG: SDR family oxidoreductase [Moraxellaceae bacterium]|nr:SDR family oxidoreductase [Moraxellaceae bacterium]MDP1775568.1 SDR family oxidoreductase [Moraxellaceae bacterium]